MFPNATEMLLNTAEWEGFIYIFIERGGFNRRLSYIERGFIEMIYIHTSRSYIPAERVVEVHS
jgi:hypothetical protein